MADRGEQIKTERRRRDTDGLTGRRTRLGVTEEALDREKYAYRWITDDGTRLHQLTVLDDWEPVPDRDGTVKPDGTDMGAKISAVVGTGAYGAAQRGVLCRKLKAYYNDDQRLKQTAIDEKEAGLKSGAVPGASNGALRAPDDPDRQIRLTRGDP